MKQNREILKKKRVYQKPFIKTIQLEAEEVLGNVCLASPTGPNAVGTNCSFVSPTCDRI